MKSVAIASLVLLVAAAGANAGTVTMQAASNVVSPGMPGRIYDIPHFQSGVSTTAGVFNFLVTAVDDTGGPVSGLVAGQTLKAFDLEMQFLDGSNNVYTVKQLEDAPDGAASPGPGTLGSMGANRASLIRNLWFQHDAVIDTGTAVEAAAFQLAVWAIVYDPIDDINVLGAHTISNPGFWTTNFDTSVTDLANNWLSTLDANGNQLPGILALVDPSNQDFMYLRPLPNQGFVPLPGAVWMGLAMLTGLAAVRARRRRRI